MKKIIFALTLLFTAYSSAFAQQEGTLKILDSIVEVKPWVFKSLFGLNGSQTSFVNWAAGGRNNISAIGFVDASAKYNKKKWMWESGLKLALGGVLYQDSAGRKSGIQKTDDKIELSTTVGYEFSKNHWYYTFVGGFRTQWLNGYNYPNDSTKISGFMSPGYVNISLGIEWKPKPWFNAYISPVAGKITMVRDDSLANAGAFGVDGAKYADDGVTMIAPGKHVRYEFGAYFRVQFEKEIAKNIQMKTKVELFSNYLDHFGNIDVNAENILTFKVNSWFSSSLQWNLLYDDDMKVLDRHGNFGPRTQFKSVLSLGISYTLVNVHD